MVFLNKFILIIETEQIFLPLVSLFHRIKALISQLLEKICEKSEIYNDQEFYFIR